MPHLTSMNVHRAARVSATVGHGLTCHWLDIEVHGEPGDDTPFSLAIFLADRAYAEALAAAINAVPVVAAACPATGGSPT